MLEGLAEYGYWGLLIAAFLSATILPLSSEAVFVALVATGMDLWTLIIYATIGNVLGGVTCYYLGRIGNTEWLEKWFKIDKKVIDKTVEWLDGKGALMGFFGFLPGIGDPILVTLGYLRANFPIVLVSMASGKFLRYVVFGFGADGIFSLIF